MNEKFDYTSAANELLYDNSGNSVDSARWVLSVLPREEGKNDPVSDQWQIHTVSIIGESFRHRVSILAVEKAREVVGDKLIFVHNSRFIAVTKGREAAIKLAFASIRAHIEDADDDIGDPPGHLLAPMVYRGGLWAKLRERPELGVQALAALAAVAIGAWFGAQYKNK
jgi:hypothetical protein